MKTSSLWLACVALTHVACAGGTAALARKPGVERLLAESRAALVELDWEQAQELADEAVRLYPGSATATAWAAQLHAGDSPWRAPALRQPLPAPGPHVVPGALLFVSAPSLPLALSPTFEEEDVTDALPLGAAVSVLEVEGGLAHVRRVGLGSLLTPGAPPQWTATPLPPELKKSEGYVDPHYLEATPVDLSALRQQVRTRLASGAREEALLDMERLLAAELWDPELRGEMHRLALELDDIPAAVRAARATLQEAPEPEPPSLEISLRYGCRGNVLTAKLHDESTAAAEPADACVDSVDVSRPKDVVAYTDCTFLNPRDEETREWWAQQQAKGYAHMEEDQERYDQEMKARQGRLDRLRQLYPQGPFLCVWVTHAGERARWDVPVQLYSMPSGEAQCRTAADEPEAETTPLVEGLQVDGLRVPYLAPGDAVWVCRKESRYEGLFYGAVLAPDAQTAADFVRRREEAHLAVVADPWGDDKEQREQALKAITEEWPNVRLDTAFQPTCDLACF